MTEIAYNKAIGYIANMNQCILKGKDYSNELTEFIELIIKKDFLQDLYFNEYWTLTYNVLWLVLMETEKREEYELCQLIMRIIENEEEIYKAWCLTLPEDQIADAEEELEYIKLQIKMEKEWKKE